MSDTPGRQQLSGYVMTDYDRLIATLCASRDSQGLTNADVGRRIPIHRASVSRWLTGLSEPYAGRLFELAGALGYDLALVPREPEADEVRPDLEPAPSAATIASVLTIVDAPYREAADLVHLEDE